MLHPIDVDHLLPFAAKHLSPIEFHGFSLYAKGLKPITPEFAHGFVIYWGFSDFCGGARSFPLLTDSDYDKGLQLAAAYLASCDASA